MSLGPDRAKSRGNKSMHVSCSIDFGSATPLSPHARAVFLALPPSLLFLPPLLTFSVPVHFFLLLFLLLLRTLQTPPLRQPPDPGVAAPILRRRRRPLPWQRSFQFSPGSRLIALTSLRPPLSAALICYPPHFTPFHRSFSLFVSPFLSRSPPSLPPSRSLSEDLKGSLFESAEWLGFAFVLFFIPMTETCWRLPILDKRVGLFFLGEDDKRPSRFREFEKVRNDTRLLSQVTALCSSKHTRVYFRWLLIPRKIR